MHIDTLALDFVVRDAQGVGPGAQRVIRAIRCDAVIRLRYVRGEGKISWIQLEGLIVEFEGFIEHLLFRDAIVFFGIHAEEKNGGGEILIIYRFERIEFDGLLVILEGLFDRAVVAVEIGKIVISGRVFIVQFERLVQLRFFAVLIANVTQEAGKSHVRLGMVGMERDEILVTFANGLEPFLDAVIEVGIRRGGACGGKLAVLSDPFIHFVKSCLIVLHKPLIFFLHEVVRAGGGDAIAHVPGSRIGGCDCRAGKNQRR